MVLQSNKKISLLLLLLFFYTSIVSQQDSEEAPSTSQDYKDPVQHEKFYKRRKLVGAWQINQLKQGALVVRLRTNKLLIDELIKNGQKELALQKELELFAINKNTMFAFIDNFNFCKVYFISANYSDSLVNGARQGIFLDTNLTVDPSIEMKESFYLLAERDYAYNSSIGFVPENMAKNQRENGNAVKQMAFVVKNKYGHQLKSPFPYAVGEKTFMNAQYELPISVVSNKNGNRVFSFYVNKHLLYDLENEKNRTNKTVSFSGNTKVKVSRQFTYEKLAIAVLQLNTNMQSYFQSTPAPDPLRIPHDAKLFLY